MGSNLGSFKKNKKACKSHIIDSTIVKAHQHSAGARKHLGEQAIGRSRGGRTTKIHWVINSQGLPIDFNITGGQVDDSKMAIPLLHDKSSKYVIGDKAYDTNANREMLKLTSREAVIPSSRRRFKPLYYNTNVYKERSIIECFICWTKKFRRVATRYEKTSLQYRGMIMLTCVLAWM
jgi:transposase